LERLAWPARLDEACGLEIDPRVFLLRCPLEIATSLKRSAERTRRRSEAPFRAAMSSLLHYMQRMRRRLTRAQRAKLEAVKVELRALYKDAPPEVRE
jgi:hypothetical protein